MVNLNDSTPTAPSGFVNVHWQKDNSGLVSGNVPDTTNAGNITSGTLAIARGGTGQATQQAAIDALTGTQSAGKYLRSDGTHATLDSIHAADLPAISLTTGVSGILPIASGG